MFINVHKCGTMCQYEHKEVFDIVSMHMNMCGAFCVSNINRYGALCLYT